MSDLITQLENEAIERGWNKGLDLGLRKGLEQGLKHGMHEGIREGIRRSRLQIVQALTDQRIMDVPHELVERLTDMDDAHWCAIIQRLPQMDSLMDLHCAVEDSIKDRH